MKEGNPPRPRRGGQTGPIDYMCIKNKTSFKAKLGKFPLEQMPVITGNSSVTFQSAAIGSRTARSLKVKFKFFGGPVVKPLKWQVVMACEDFMSPAQSRLA